MGGWGEVNGTPGVGGDDPKQPQELADELGKVAG